MSQRLLLAIADRDVASSAAALAQEGEGLEVVAVVDEPEEVSRALRRHDVDVVVLHDALGAVPVLDLARELCQAFPETGLVLIAATTTDADCSYDFAAALQRDAAGENHDLSVV